MLMLQTARKNNTEKIKLPVRPHHRTRCAHCAQALIAFDDVGCDRRAYICVRRVPGGEYGDTPGGTQLSRNEHRALPAGRGAAP